MAQFPYRVRGDEAVDVLVATVRGEPEVVAGCYVGVSAHGFAMEMEFLQRAEGGFQYSSWNDVQGNISVEERSFELDLTPLVERARGLAGGFVHGSGRRVLVVLADRNGGYWIDAPESGVPELAELFAVVFR